uniref:NADH-plastoquinone oxidoreductase subunit 4 n=2 Tax=Gentiana TaxID=21496 RepID=A0A1C9IIH1_9GENT|nr:NADH-plastoquinone oxidoreductase subunit 4 [Gentiana hexaphylla]AOP04344.1 NADH-plastoquinone oxidoreductase subunit 4 [Gentiana lawrencei var. farreri]AWO66828.1 NADH-plastoquinone oxidoreductase subunit 4 [Gentiana hexaphylla]
MLITFLMAIGIILIPIYSLSLSRQMFYGYKLFNAQNSYFFDSEPARVIYSNFSLFTRPKYWYVPRFNLFTVG